jgi:hypothetical protein
MPQGNSTLRTNLSSTAAPNRAVASGGQVQQITINLGFESGINYKPIDIIDALETKYGAGKVRSPRDSQPPYGTLDLVVTP